MPDKRPIPVDVEDFKVLVDKDYFFIDKTFLIKDLLDSKDMISLITRPRRFGKTLNMSMIQRFFEKAEDSNAYLFEGLKISNAGEKYLNHQGQYPVISISLKGLKQITYEKAFFVFKERIISEFERHQYVYDSGVLPVNKHKRFEKILIGNAKDDEYLTALQLLSECLEDFHNKKVILLIELNVRCDVALEQIRTKKYAEQLTDDCYQKVMSYGIAFYGKTCRVKMGKLFIRMKNNESHVD